MSNEANPALGGKQGLNFYAIGNLELHNGHFCGEHGWVSTEGGARRVSSEYVQDHVCVMELLGP